MCSREPARPPQRMHIFGTFQLPRGCLDRPNEPQLGVRLARSTIAGSARLECGRLRHEVGRRGQVNSRQDSGTDKPLTSPQRRGGRQTIISGQRPAPQAGRRSRTVPYRVIAPHPLLRQFPPGGTAPSKSLHPFEPTHNQEWRGAGIRTATANIGTAGRGLPADPAQGAKHDEPRAARPSLRITVPGLSPPAGTRRRSAAPGRRRPPPERRTARRLNPSRGAPPG